MAPLDIVPGVTGLTKFSGTVRLAHAGENIGHLGLGMKGSFKQGVMHIDNMVKTAGQQSVTRLRSASSAARDAANVVKNKLAKDIIEVGKAADTAVTHVRNNFSPRTLLDPEYAEVGKVATSAENTHAIENSVAGMVSKIKGINIEGVAKGTGNTSSKVNNIKEINEVNYGDHFTKGKRGRKELAPNVRYVTQDEYKYTTDGLGRIVDVEADSLILKEADRNLGMQRAAGREDRLPDDDGGHLIGSQFHGSGDIDNLVAQNSQINRSGGQWYKMETEWAEALKETPPRKVSVKIEPIYLGNSLRPDSFEVVYEIEGKGLIEKIIKNKPGG